MDSGNEQFFSQDGQDRFLERNVFKGKRDGVFLEIGANDGLAFSNTLFFERFRGWKGICVEPIPTAYEKLRVNRKAIAVQGCVAAHSGTSPFQWVKGSSEMLSGLPSKYNKKHVNRVEREVREFGGSTEVINVQCHRVADLLATNGFSRVDYCSIDTEGGELDILKSLDFDTLPIDVFSVENQYGKIPMRSFMWSRGYNRIARVGADDIYRFARRRPLARRLFPG